MRHSNHKTQSNWGKIFDKQNIPIVSTTFGTQRRNCSCNANDLTCSLIEVDIDALELQVGVAMVGAGRVDTVLVGDHLPELEYQENR